MSVENQIVLVSDDLIIFERQGETTLFSGALASSIASGDHSGVFVNCHTGVLPRFGPERPTTREGVGDLLSQESAGTLTKDSGKGMISSQRGRASLLSDSSISEIEE